MFVDVFKSATGTLIFRPNRLTNTECEARTMAMIIIMHIILRSEEWVRGITRALLLRDDAELGVIGKISVDGAAVSDIRAIVVEELVIIKVFQMPCGSNAFQPVVDRLVAEHLTG